MMMTDIFDYSVIHPSWHECIKRGVSRMDANYLGNLRHSDTWLPGPQKIFSAFSLPLSQVQYVLFGESPYPRQASANGYAFWDEAVVDLWSPTGLDKKVNRATSLRNMVKMLLIADGKLHPTNTSQDDIAVIDKSHYVKTNHEFFNNFLQQGFLLLNATPVLQPGLPPQKDARAWHPFIKEVLQFLLANKPQTQLILFGKIAEKIDPLIADHPIKALHAEHPYNLSFMTNPTVLAFFNKLKLLSIRVD